ncbi:MAG: hypothetical protein ACREVO_07995 [Steroidobacteraceae bacterium]
MLKRIAPALTALLAVACVLPALAVGASPAQAPLRVLATRTVHAGRHSLGLFLFLVGAAVVVWLVLRWRAARMGYPHYPGQYRSGAQPPGYGPAGYPPGGYMPGGLGIMGSVASGPASVPPAEAPPAPDPKADRGGRDAEDPGSKNRGSD